MFRNWICALACVAATFIGFNHAQAATYDVTITDDFFTTAWAFGAPYVRDADRPQLGISSTNPYGMGEYAWEEVTYFVFDMEGAGITGTVDSAILTVTTALRSGVPIPEEGIIVTAHQLSANPLDIDPSLSSSSADPNSYYNFSTTQIGDAVASTLITAVDAQFTFDLTDIVNEWLANGDANYPYALAFTGRDPSNSQESWTSFVNTGYAGAPSFVVTTTDGDGGTIVNPGANSAVPEPASATLLGTGLVILAMRRKRN